MTTADDVERVRRDGVRSYAGQRISDTKETAEVRATTRAAKDRRILGQWAMGERCVTTIARAVGCTRDYAAKVLRKAGKEVPETKRKGAKLGAIIRRTKGERG